jgi:hypothetical protein
MNTSILDGIIKIAVGTATMTNVLGRIAGSYNPSTITQPQQRRLLQSLYRMGQGSAAGSNLNLITNKFRGAISSGSPIPAAPGGASWGNFLGGLANKGADMSRQFIR